MAEALIINGNLYNYPNSPTDQNWGSAASAWAQAVTTGLLQKGTAGTTQLFTLLSDVNFGPNFGLQALYFKSNAGTGIGTAGVLRLLKTDSVNWRNNAGTADLALGINGSDQLTFNGSTIAIIGNVVSGPASSTNFAIPTFNGTPGNLLRNTGVTIDASNNITGVVNFTSTGIGTFVTLSVSGTASLGEITTDNISCNSVNTAGMTTTGSGTIGNLTVGTKTTTGSLSVTGTSSLVTLAVSGVATLGSSVASTVGSTDNSSNIATSAFVVSAIQTSGKNSQGVKTISASSPSGGASGDVWYQI